MYNSDYEKMGEEEMQWHDDGYLGNNFEGEAKKSLKVWIVDCWFQLNE